MTRIVTKSQTVLPSFHQLVDFLAQSRNASQSTDLRIGINHAIVFYSACYVEGVMEAMLKMVVARRRRIFNKVNMPDLDVRRPMNMLFNALAEDLQLRISRSTGIEPYINLVNLLTGVKLLQNKEVAELWEGITVLFQFRNVLAHGREIRAARVSAYWIKEPWQDQFSGGYANAEKYLLKRGLIDKGFMDSDHLDLFFTDPIADHFWSLSSDFVTRVAHSLGEEDRTDVLKMLSEETTSPE